MKKTTAAQSGFTLVEMLVVISIILIIATIGVGSYSMARRSMLMDIETDKLVALMHSSREESRAAPRCTGIKFKKHEPPQKIEARRVDGECDLSALTATPLPLANGIQASAVALDAAERNELFMLFLPPFGAIKLQPDAKTAEITFSMKSGGNASRVISINKDTGKIEKK